MASDAQISANRENAQKSTGPTTLEGKAQSRLNATTHGLAGAYVAISSTSPERLALRIAQWSDGRAPQTERERWLVETIAIATIRIDLCHDEENALRETDSQRAAILWDEERRVDAEQLGAKLHRNPGLMVAKLKRNVQGCAWLRERWESLESLAETGDWDASQRALALDMLAVPRELREHCLHIPAGPDRAALTKLARREIDKIDATIEKGLELLDRREQECAVAGLMFIASAGARLIRRYEAEAWKRFWWAERELKACRKPTEVPFRNEPDSLGHKPLVYGSAVAEANLPNPDLRNEPKFPIADEQSRQSEAEDAMEVEAETEQEPTPEPAPSRLPRRKVFKNRKARRAAEAKERTKKA